MKRHVIYCFGILLLFQYTVSQNNRERRLYINDYVAPEELVSMSKTLQLDKAMLLFSDFSKKYLNKIVVDASNNKKPIGTDIENMYWMQAFETVLRNNNLWYEEREEFFYVYPVDETTKGGGAVTGGGVSTVKVDSMGKVILRQRDIRISSVFFTIDVVKSMSAGINWNFFYSGDSSTSRPTRFGANMSSGISDPFSVQTNEPGFAAKIIPAIKFSNISALISFFQSNQLGDVLSGPSIVVSSGKQGRIQVGQDIFITTRDFAGNTIQQPVSSGIIIDVKPTVYNENGIKFINLDVKAERSTVSAGPIINKSSAQTFSVLYDGEETVIGGLYTNSESVERGGIPLLKDLPWWFFGLRYIFGYDKSSTTTNELIILLKAEVVPTVEERIATAAERKGINPIEVQRAKTASEIERLKVKK